MYCQNYSISQSGEGRETSALELASIMLKLQDSGAHNINFVTPTHVLPQIVEALIIARDKGLSLPLVYNSAGYDTGEILDKVEGIFDMYMPDVKYSDEENGQKYSFAKDYWEVCKKALISMHRNVGDLIVDQDNIAQRGLIVRHLVLPGNISGSLRIIDFIVENLSKNAYVNIMDQYRPCHEAYMYKELSRSITAKEYQEVVDYALQKGLRRGFKAI